MALLTLEHLQKISYVLNKMDSRTKIKFMINQNGMLISGNFYQDKPMLYAYNFAYEKAIPTLVQDFGNPLMSQSEKITDFFNNLDKGFTVLTSSKYLDILDIAIQSKPESKLLPIMYNPSFLTHPHIELDFYGFAQGELINLVGLVKEDS